MALTVSALEIAKQGAIRLAQLTDEKGRFRYRYDSTSDEDQSGYNVLRHAGTIWAMLDVHRDVKDPELLEAAKRAAHYLLDRYLRFFRGYNNTCICEDNKIKLGGNALSTLALLEVYRATGDNFLLAISEQLCLFMLDQKREQGELVHKRYFRSGKISAFRSEYYVGEALLALLTLYDLTREEALIEEVREIEDELAASDYGVREQSHWMLYSLELLQRFDDKESVYDHAAKIAADIIERPLYLDWNRSTPVACRSEGLLAFLRMRHPPTQEAHDLRRECVERLELNLEKQASFLLPDGSFVRGGDDRRHEEVRIDYIQHNISSFLHYHRQFSANQP